MSKQDNKNDQVLPPNHIAIIMDGNGRWATKRLLPRMAGHSEGVKTLEKITDATFDAGVKVLTVYAFSTENQARPKGEVKNLCALIREFFKKKLHRFIEGKIAIKIIGDVSFFDEDIQNIIKDSCAKTIEFKNKTFVLALNYGARDEIVRAVNNAITAGKQLTQEDFGNLLDTKELPDPDLIIRSGGDKRLSNFLLYQAAYAELFFVDDLWPDFKPRRLQEILDQYANRNRRFGKV